MEEFKTRSINFQVFLLEENKYIEAPEYLHICLAHTYELLEMMGYDSVGLYSTQGMYVMMYFWLCQELKARR